MLEAPSGSIWIINPDKLSKHIHEHEHLALNPHANLAAVRRMEKWLHASVKAYRTVGVETVLSTAKYRRLVRQARKHGFRVRLIYVFLKTADLNLERVAIRVAKGGHDVDPEKILARRTKSFRQLSWFFAEADEVDVYDNSGAKPELVIAKRDGEIVLNGRLIPELAYSLAAAYPDLRQELLDEVEPPTGT